MTPLTPLVFNATLAVDDTVCLSYAQQHFIFAEVSNTLYGFGVLVLIVGLIFGFIFGWIIKRDWG